MKTPGVITFALAAIFTAGFASAERFIVGGREMTYKGPFSSC